MKKQARIGCAIVFLGSMVVACGSEPEPSANETPDVSLAFADTSSYQALRGTVALALNAGASVARVELFSGSETTPVAVSESAPFTLTWDTTTSADGPLALHAVATAGNGDSAQTEALTVVVLNNGVETALAEGDSGTIVIPSNFNGTQEVDAKSHWTNPTSITRILAVIHWPQSEANPWNLELSIGSGWCPDSGTVLGEAVTSERSPLAVEVTDLASFASGQMFAHVKPMNASVHLAQQVEYAVKVFLFE